MRVLNVLIADDNAAFADSLREAILDGWTPPGGADTRVRVEVCGDGEAAWAKLGALPFDAVICDAYMPQMNGADLLRIAREQGLAIPFLLVSGDDGGSLERHAVRHRAEFCCKPVRMNHLFEWLDGHLDKPSAACA